MSKNHFSNSSLSPDNDAQDIEILSERLLKLKQRAIHPFGLRKKKLAGLVIS